jgi:1-acyl-sn-glycerol-3-phosphate acyltransferase
VEVLARPVEQLDERTVRVAVQAIADGAVLVSLDLVEILVPKGRIGRAEPRDRLAFLRDRKFVPGLGLSVSDGDATLLADADVRGVDWLPGTVDEVWRVGGDRTAQIAMKEHAAARLGVHPGDVRIDGDVARHPALPCTVVRLHVGRDAEGVSVHGEPESDIGLVEHFWDAWFARGRWPVEDLYYALVRRFIRRVVIEDPEALQSVARQSLLFLGNHQVGIESLLFSIVASGLVRAPTVTVAKAEHRTSWLGTLIADCFSYPGIVDPEVITFFDRDDKESLPVLVRRLGEQMATRRPRNAMVHVEGTRSLECRTPVRKMSGSFIDMAIAVGAPIVPVRFVGGLPVEPLAERIEFPFGLGRQDLYIGRPLLPGALANMTYKQRKDAVIDGINGLGPAPAAETPLPPDPALQERVQAHAQRTGVCAEDAVLAVLLEDLPDPCAETVQIRSGGGSAWAQGLRRRLWGE